MDNFPRFWKLNVSFAYYKLYFFKDAPQKKKIGPLKKFVCIFYLNLIFVFINSSFKKRCCSTKCNRKFLIAPEIYVLIFYSLQQNKLKLECDMIEMKFVVLYAPVLPAPFGSPKYVAMAGEKPAKDWDTLTDLTLIQEQKLAKNSEKIPTKVGEKEIFGTLRSISTIYFV